MEVKENIFFSFIIDLTGNSLFKTIIATMFYMIMSCMCAKLLHSCPTLLDPIDCSLPGSSVHEILQSRILEWVAISYSKEASRAV